MVTSTAYGYIVFYQICMVLFLTESKSLDEAVLVTVILVVTVGYISVNGGKINDLGLHGEKKPRSGIELELLLKEWRQDYDHPSQVTKVGSKKQDLLAKKTKDVDNWDNYTQDPLINNLWMVNPLGGTQTNQQYSPAPDVEMLKYRRSQQPNRSIERINRSIQNIEQYYYRDQSALENSLNMS